MKHRPMLMHKYNQKQQERGREVIGLIGTHHGVGVTHTAFMLAFYMGGILGKKTALLECNKHRDFSIIQDNYGWFKQPEGSFSYQSITCYKEVASNQIVNIYGDEYECILIDFGIDLKDCRNEFLRCSTKIVIGGRSEWDRVKLQRFVNETDFLRGSSSWLYFIPHADDRTVITASSVIKRKVYSVPKETDPTLPSRLSNKFFSQIF